MGQYAINIYEWGDNVSKLYLSIRRFFRSKFCGHIVSLLLAVIAVMAFCHCANAYPSTQRTLADILSFVFVFGGIPIALLLKLWEVRPLKWYALIATIVILSISACRYYSTTIVLETDISKYLCEQSDFSKAASFVMPRKQNFSDADEVAYTHIKTYDLLGFEAMEVQLRYTSDALPSAIKCAEEQFAQLENSPQEGVDCFSVDSEGIVLYGHKYTTYTFVMDGIDYAVAYSHCTENNSVSYILLSSTCLSFMSPGDLLETNDYQGYIFANK